MVCHLKSHVRGLYCYVHATSYSNVGTNSHKTKQLFELPKLAIRFRLCCDLKGTYYTWCQAFGPQCLTVHNDIVQNLGEC